MTYRAPAFLKWLALLWIPFVFGLFCWNILPHTWSMVRTRFERTKTPAANVETAGPRQEQIPARPAPQKTDPVIPSKSESPEATELLPGKWASLGANVARVGVFCLIFLLSHLAGRKVMSAMKLVQREWESTVSTAFGLGILSYAMLLLGTLSLLKFSWLLGFLFLFLFIFARDLRKDRPGIRLPGFPEGSRLTKILLGGMLVLLFFNAMIPDQFYDSLSYHLALPRTYLNEGGIVPVTHNVHSSFPQTAEMLFTLGMGIGGNDHIPLLIQLGCGVLILCALIERDPKTGLLAGLLWLCAPIVVENIRFAKSDIFLTLWVTLAFFSMLDWSPGEGHARLIAAGIFSGLATGTKYTGAVFTAVLLAILLTRNRNQPVKDQAKAAFIYLGVSFAVFSPWLIKNFVVFHNPIYPFFQELFGYVQMRPENWSGFRLEQSQFWGDGWHWSHFLSTIWNQTFDGHLYPSMRFIGPVWLAFIPAALMYGREDRQAKAGLIFVFSIYLISVTQTTLARYFFLPVLPILSFVIIRSFDGVRDLRVRKYLTVFLFAGVFLNGIGWLPALERVAYGRSALFGLSPEREAKLYRAGYAESVRWVNDRITVGSKILFIGETRSHLFRRKVIAPSVHNEHILSQIAAECSSGEELYDVLSGQGYTHILLNRQELKRVSGYPTFFWKEGDRELLRDFWNKHLEEIHFLESVIIYEITGKSGKPALIPPEFDLLFKEGSQS